MYFDNLLPSVWEKSALPVKHEGGYPYFDLKEEVNRVFDHFFKGFDLAPFEAAGGGFGQFNPNIDIKENEKEIIVTAELPGLDKKDFDLLLTDDALTIKGEKKEEKEDKGKDYYRMERSYGSFQRVIPLPEEIDSTKVDATFKNGVLKIILPKTEEVENKVKKIVIKKD